MNFKAIAAAAALLASTSSFAVINDTTNAAGGGLFLAVINSTLATPESYELDLGLTLNDIAAQVNNASYSKTWTVNDANFTTFLQHAGGDVSSLKWLVEAGSYKGASNTANNNLLVSTLAGGVTLADVKTTTQGNLNSGISNGAAAGLSLFANSVNPLLSASGSALTVAGASNAYVGPNSPVANLQDALGGKLSFSQLNTVGATGVNLAYLSNPGGRLGSTTVNAALFVGSLSFTANTTGGYDLTYASAAAPAVPEPSTYALLVAGLAAVGLVARRRSV